MKDVVGESASDARDGSLISKHRVQPPGVVARRDQFLVRRRRWFRSQSLEGAGVVGDENPPRGFPLRAELLQEERRRGAEPEPDQRAFRFRGLRGVFYVDATRRERWSASSDFNGSNGARRARCRMSSANPRPMPATVR